MNVNEFQQLYESVKCEAHGKLQNQILRRLKIIVALRFLLTIYESLETSSRQFSFEESVDVNKTRRPNFPEDNNPHIMKKEDQQDEAIRCLLLTSVSACFGHHYAHLQENKDRVLLHTVYCAGSAGCGW